MKKLIMYALASMCLAGCKTLPTPAELETASYAIGVSTALVMNMSKLSDKDRQIIIDIVNDVKYSCPTAGQTMVEAWTKAAEDHVKKLVEQKVITEVEGQLILKTFDLVVSTGDYMVRIRWPKIGQNVDLILAATNGFCDGFLTKFKPANVNGFAAPAVRMGYDVDAYNYLMSVKK